MIAETAPGPATPPAAAPPSPFKFLDYFTDSAEDRRRFGGRDREVRELVTRITNERVLTVYGPSGIGKTSLLLAGVFPELRERGVRPVYARTLASPVDDVCRAVTEACGLEPLAGKDLRTVLERASEELPLVLVLDQFEELFVRFRDRPEERAVFIQALTGAVKDEALGLSVVFSLREDYLASLDELEAGLPGVMAAHRYRVRPLTAFGVRQAVAKPLTDARIPYETAVVSRIILQLEEVDFEPPLLQILCTELYNEAARRAGGGVPRITVGDLERLGGRDGIFRRYLNGVTGALPEDRLLLARMVLDALITDEGTKRASTLADLGAAGFSAEEGEIREIVERFADHRLLRREERDGVAWYELVHERLVPVLREWLDLDREFFEFRQARSYVRNNSAGELWRQSPGTLLGEGTLESLLGPNRERFRFDGRELELVVRSALYRRSRELPFWAGRYGIDRARALLHELLASPRERERSAAAASARLLPDEDGGLARACLRAALEDPSEEVRREAGLSLAKLARDEEIGELRRAYRDRARRERVREVLSSLQAGGHPLAGFGRLDRLRAERREARRVLSEQGAALRRRWVAGTAAGALAGAAWQAGSVGLREFLDWLRGPATYRPLVTEWSDLMSIGIELGGMALIGALLGWIASLAAAREEALQKPGRWHTNLVRSPLLLALWGLFFAGLGVSNLVADFMGPWETAGVLAFFGFVGFGSLALARWSLPLVGPGSSRTGVWLGSLLASAGLPVLGVFLILTGIRKLLAPYFLSGSVLDVADVSAGAFFIALIALERSSARPALPGRRGRRLAVSLAAVALVPFWFGRFYGFETVLPEVLDYEPGREVSRSWRPRPEAGRVDPPPFELQNATGQLQIVEVESKVDPVNGLGAVALGTNPRIENGETLLLPPGRFQGRFQTFFPGKGTRLDPADHRGTTLRLREKSRGRRFDPSNLRQTDPFPWDWLAPEPVSGQPGEWRIGLRGRLDASLLPPGHRLDQYRVHVVTWCEGLKPRPGTALRLRALDGGELLEPNEAPPRLGMLPELTVLPGREVAVPLGKDLVLGLPNVADGVSWFARPDAQGRWSLEVRLRETGTGAAGRTPEVGELFVIWQSLFVPE